MATSSHRHTKLRPDTQGKLRKGVCENHQYSNPDTGEVGDCPECTSGKIQAVNVQRLSDFKCDVCGGRLTPVKTPFPTKAILLALSGFILLGALIFCSIWFGKDNSLPDPEPLPAIVPVDSIIVSKAEYTLYIGDSTKIATKVIPSKATDTTVVWMTSNPNIVSVSDGNIKAVDKGQATITIKSNDGNASAVVGVNVISHKVNNLKPMPLPTPNREPIPQPVTAIKIPDDIQDALNVLIDESFSREDRLNSISGIINKFFESSAKVRTLGDNGITLDYENVEDCFRRIVLSRRIAEIQLIEQEMKDKITEIGIQEIHK